MKPKFQLPNTILLRRNRSTNIMKRKLPKKCLSISYSKPDLFAHASNYINTHKLFLSNDIEAVKNLDMDINFKSQAPSGESLRQAIDYNQEARNYRLGLSKRTPSLLSHVGNNQIRENNTEENSCSSRNMSQLKGYDGSHMERDLEDQLKQSKEEYEQLKKVKFELQTKIRNELKNIDGKNIELEMLNQGEKSGFEPGENMLKKKQGKLNMFILKTLHAQELNSKIHKREEIKAEKEKSLQIINQTEKELSELKVKIKEKKQFVTETTNKLMLHYQQLLYDGSDVRQEGLIWIIKAIWNLGKNVPMEYFPSFLDFQAVDYLFTVAHKTLLLAKTKNEITQTKKQLQKELVERKKERENNEESKENEKSDELFRTSIFPIKNKEMIKALSQNNIFMMKRKEEEENEELNLKKIKLLLQKRKSNIDSNLIQHISQINFLTQKMKMIEREIHQLKKNEMRRLFKEFMENDYERRYNVIIDVVIAALVGEYNKHSEMAKVTQRRKQYKKDIQHIQFYNVAAFPTRNMHKKSIDNIKSV